MKNKISSFIFKLFQGALVGLGAELPGMSGGVLCVVFGFYTTIMEFLADPIHKFKTHFPKLLPVGIGGVIGFIGVAKLLSELLEKYPAPSMCVFIGLIAGTLPSLFKEAGEKGRNKASFVSMGIAMIFIFALLIGLRLFSVQIEPNFMWYLFCGFCVALSIIAPGMSFSTLLMPLGLYQHFNDGIGDLDFSVIIPVGIGALATIIILAKPVDMLFKKHHSVAFHGIVGIVIAATIMIIPFESFAVSVTGCIINIVCIAAGVVTALLLDKFNSKYETKE